jgi:hypothetical protein
MMIVTKQAASVSSRALARRTSRIFTSGNANNGRVMRTAIIIKRDKYENDMKGTVPVPMNNRRRINIR